MTDIEDSKDNDQLDVSTPFQDIQESDTVKGQFVDA